MAIERTNTPVDGTLSALIEKLRQVESVQTEAIVESSQAKTGRTPNVLPPQHFTAALLREKADELFRQLNQCTSLEQARHRLFVFVDRIQENLNDEERVISRERLILRRDCARIWRSLLHADSDRRCGFSVVEALWDLAQGKGRGDLSAGFFAEIIHLYDGLIGHEVPLAILDDELSFSTDLTGREAANIRSEQLDELWQIAQRKMDRYKHGLQQDIIAKREEFHRRLLDVFNTMEKQWRDWRWQVDNIVTDENLVKRLLHLSDESSLAIAACRKNRLPFGVTPFYLSLMDETGSHDQALRAQVFPSKHYVDQMTCRSDADEDELDFMGEQDTSPVDLVTRRYPGIAILKPYNTCPQICVYCQRNWEIGEAMAAGALAPEEKILAALEWIGKHPAVHEVLITGGDPLVLDNSRLKWILDRVAAIPSVERIRVGTRTPVTLPYRITNRLTELLGSYRRPGYREIALVTHIEHPYELNPAMVEAVDRLRRQGIGVYNQLVYTFYNSRRFEATLLRKLLRLVGIDPYYTFNTKGKKETMDYRVPIARLMQEQKEEARLLPGLARTDECVYNVPRLGKNHLRALQHRDLIGIKPDGARVYEFHPWEKNIVKQSTYVTEDVPILAYLQRLQAIGENPQDYESIWYYF